MLAIPNDLFSYVDQHQNAHDTWQALESLHSKEEHQLMKHDLMNGTYFHMYRLQALLSESSSPDLPICSQNESERSITFNKDAIPLNTSYDMDVSEYTLIENLVKIGNDLQDYSLNDMNTNIKTSNLSDCSSNNLKSKTRNSEYYKKKMEIALMKESGQELKKELLDFFVDTDDDEEEISEPNMVFIANVEEVAGMESLIEHDFEAHEEDSTPSYDTDAEDDDTIVGKVHTSDACDYDALDELIHGHPRTISKLTIVTT